MRRLFAAVLLCSTVALLGAAAPTPTPAPLPTVGPRLPTATAAPAVSGITPVVLIYPFQAPSDLDKRYGTAIAQIYAQVFTDTGGLKVLAIPDGIKQEDYEKYAAVQHADYYISGYIQPIGDGASIVSQIFDVGNDIGVNSQTTQIQNVNDIGSQALNARAIMLARSGVDRPELQVSQATPAPSSTTGAQVSVNNVLGDLFKGHPKSSKGKPGPAASPTPPPKPSRGVIVAKVTGSSSSTDLANASDTLTRALADHFNWSQTATAISDISHQADAICGTNRNNTIATGVLDTSRTGGVRAHNTYKFTMNVATCFGAILYTTTQSGDDHVKVVKDAVDAYVTDHPDNN